ncbi:MAG: hypothetical protein P8186_23145 [Anaerolineae bacterium]
MMKDERINGVRRRIAARGFGIWYVLLLLALLYRQFYLGQPVSDYWDMALIFFIGTLYVTIAGFARGAVYENAVIRFGKWSVPIIVITIVAVSYYQGQIHSAVDLVVIVVSALVGLSVFGLVSYYLYRRWEKQNILDN